jgi:ABC-2 type transport system permease protein
MVEKTELGLREFHGRWQGFLNLFHAELNRWFGTRRWIWQSLLWILLIDGMIGAIGIASRFFEELNTAAADVRQVFGLIAAFGSIGTVILMQTVIIREKENGVASWILSKPVSRGAYVLAKLLGNTAGVLVSVVLIPGLICYPLLSWIFIGSWLPFGNFLLALGVLALDILFYLSLTILLGTVFDKPAPVMALPLVLIFGQQPLIGLIPKLIHVLPYTLSTATAGAVLFGESIPFPMPLLATAGMIGLFTGLAVFRFDREEF